MALTETRILPSGREVTLTMPDLWAILSSVGSVPNPLIVPLLKLLDGAAALDEASEVQRLRAAVDNLRGLYRVAELCLATPKLRLDGKPPEDGEIGPADLAFADLWAIYYGFFRSGPAHPPASAATDEPGGPQEPAPGGGDLPPDPGVLAGDNGSPGGALPE